jgi:phage tail-like protein
LANERVNGASANGLAPAVSSYLQYLPAPYQIDPFLGRFLLIFESVLDPIERTIDNVPHYLDPGTTPAELLPWLAGWLDSELDENWPLEKRRELVRWAAILYRWRGTRRALREHLRIYVGLPPLIVENFDGLRLGQDGAMGVNARLGEALECSIAVTVLAERPEELDEQVLRNIIETEKPAHVGYLLDVQPTS